MSVSWPACYAVWDVTASEPLQGANLIEALHRIRPVLHDCSVLLDAGASDAKVAVLDRSLLEQLTLNDSTTAFEGRPWHHVASQSLSTCLEALAGSAAAQAALAQRPARPALFLDRDGVLNVDHGWVGTRERWEWIPGAKEAIHLATAQGWHVFVVTNQSGIARGYYDDAAVHVLHDWMLGEVLQVGGTIDDVRYRPPPPKRRHSGISAQQRLAETCTGYDPGPTARLGR